MITTNEEYKRIVEEIFKKMSHLAATKGAEYAHGDDRLDNFRRNGADCGIPMEVCWRIYAGKHWDSITTYIRDLQTGTKRDYSEDISGRALDLMVYLTLFICMVKERQGIQTKHEEIATPSGSVYIPPTEVVDRLVPRYDVSKETREEYLERKKRDKEFY